MFNMFKLVKKNVVTSKIEKKIFVWHLYIIFWKMLFIFATLSIVTPSLQAASQYEAIMRVLEEERDYYRTEYEALKAAKRSSARATPTKVNSFYRIQLDIGLVTKNL